MVNVAPAPVLVGIDGSEDALRAVDLGVDEALRRHRRLALLHAWTWPLVPVPAVTYDVNPAQDTMRVAAENIMESARARAEERARAAGAENLEVETRIIGDVAAHALIEASREAAMVVLGTRGLGGFAAMLLGSVGIHVAAHASSPVIVVRGEHRPGEGPVLVGVDGSPGARSALEFAFEEASLRRVPVTAVHVWNSPVIEGLGVVLPIPYELSDVASQAERLLAEQLAGWQEKYPDVPVTQRVEHGSVPSTLLEASQDAGLVVVGSRGLGGFRGLLLGSVSQAVLHHATCPVAIVHPTQDAPGTR